VFPGTIPEHKRENWVSLWGGGGGGGEELSVKQKYQSAKFQIKRDCYSSIWLRDLAYA